MYDDDRRLERLPLEELLVFRRCEDHAMSIARLVQARMVGGIYRRNDIDLFIQAQIAYHMRQSAFVKEIREYCASRVFYGELTLHSTPLVVQVSIPFTFRAFCQWGGSGDATIQSISGMFSTCSISTTLPV